MSSKKDIPTEYSVRAFYVGGRDEYDPNPVSEQEMYADFDRFIAHVRASAWQQGADAGFFSSGGPKFDRDNPYRD